MVSTGAGNRESISLMASYVFRQCTGAGWGLSRAYLVALDFFGDAADCWWPCRFAVSPSLARWRFWRKFMIISTTGCRPLGVSDLDLDTL